MLVWIIFHFTSSKWSCMWVVSGEWGSVRQDVLDTEVCKSCVVIIINTEHWSSSPTILSCVALISAHYYVAPWSKVTTGFTFIITVSGLFRRLSSLVIVISLTGLSTSQSNLQKVSRIPARIAQVKVAERWQSSDNILQSMVNLFCGCSCRNYQERFVSTFFNIHSG